MTKEESRGFNCFCVFYRNPSALANAERTLNFVRNSHKCFKGLAASLLNEDMHLLGRFYTSGIYTKYLHRNHA